MNNIDIRLKYQRYSGHSLQTINEIVQSSSKELLDYVHWLEERVAAQMK